MVSEVNIALENSPFARNCGPLRVMLMGALGRCGHGAKDFLDNLQISLEDLKYTKEHGYAKGISNIFVKQLRDLKPNERPIHCSDKKRLQFYVKDNNSWERDAQHKKIDSTIQDITIKQIKQLKEWEKAHPNYLKDETKPLKKA